MPVLNRICERCGKDFYARPCYIRVGMGRFCSRTCYWGERIERTCANPECRKTFLIIPSRLAEKRGRFCSVLCYWNTERESAKDIALELASAHGSDECLVLDSSTEYYGIAWVKGRPMGLHRFIYERLVGPIPEGHNICHSCDNPPCFNPWHLFSGTDLDNMSDKIQKGRASYPRGEDQPMSKLTERDVVEIRALAKIKTQKALASKFGVVQAQISRIVTRKDWKHI